jgi:hypothetical protein
MTGSGCSIREGYVTLSVGPEIKIIQQQGGRDPFGYWSISTSFF